VNGVLKGTATDTTYNSGQFALKGTQGGYFKSVTYLPSISYADDFSTDTVSGTIQPEVA
jgi:hypothetical protein